MVVIVLRVLQYYFHYLPLLLKNQAQKEQRNLVELMGKLHKVGEYYTLTDKDIGFLEVPVAVFFVEVNLGEEMILEDTHKDSLMRIHKLESIYTVNFGRKKNQ